MKEPVFSWSSSSCILSQTSAVQQQDLPRGTASAWGMTGARVAPCPPAVAAGWDGGQAGQVL